MDGGTLPGGSRIRRGSEVRRVFDEGRSSAAGPVVVYARSCDEDAPPRYGLVVGRRWGRAVTRNRVRRLLREAFRSCREELPRGHDFLLLPRGPLHGLRTQEVRAHLLRAARAAARRLREAGAAQDRS